MTNFLKKSFCLVSFIFITTYSLFCESFNIDYYGTKTEDINKDLTKLVSDFYYTRLMDINNLSVVDKRGVIKKNKSTEKTEDDADNWIFYTEIKIAEDDKCIVSFNLINNSGNDKREIRETYESFYRIFLSPKSNFTGIINKLLQRKQTSVKTSTEVKKETKKGKPIKIHTMETLSGIWTSKTEEDEIDKIIILRNGKGFILYKNGKSMNVDIRIDNNKDNTENDFPKIVIVQKYNSDASFYPGLAKTTAMDAAESAPPIKWTFTLYENMVLSGLKTEPVQNKTTYEIKDVKAEWNKIY